MYVPPHQMTVSISHIHFALQHVTYRDRADHIRWFTHHNHLVRNEHTHTGANTHTHTIIPAIAFFDALINVYCSLKVFCYCFGTISKCAICQQNVWTEFREIWRQPTLWYRQCSAHRNCLALFYNALTPFHALSALSMLQYICGV